MVFTNILPHIALFVFLNSLVLLQWKAHIPLKNGFALGTQRK